MSYTKTCNVDVLKTFDLRVRAANNFSPGLYSTLTTGPQQVYGSPLTWEYILLLSDVQGIKVQHSTIISSSYVILSTIPTPVFIGSTPSEAKIAARIGNVPPGTPAVPKLPITHHPATMACCPRFRSTPALCARNSTVTPS